MYNGDNNRGINNNEHSNINDINDTNDINNGPQADGPETEWWTEVAVLIEAPSRPPAQ